MLQGGGGILSMNNDENIFVYVKKMTIDLKF